MPLMREIRESKVEKNSVAVWWLGQNSYIFKSPEGALAGVDLYLTNSCASFYKDSGINLNRAVPVMIPPDAVDIDLFTCTHNHLDHTDPETIRGLRHKDVMLFAGPRPSCGVYASEGVETSRIVPAWPDCDIEFRDIRIRGTFALPTDDSDLNHMGFVFEFGHGPRIYVTGDTDFHELLYSAGKHKPDVMITCINGGFNNLSTWEAATLAKSIRPKVAIPCHYDMFPDNAVDPQMFRAALTLCAPDVGYQQLEHGKRWDFTRD